MPWFKWFFTGTLNKNDVGFVSDQKIGSIYIPILIMHAKVRTLTRKNMNLPYRHQPSQSRVDIEHWLKANTA